MMKRLLILAGFLFLSLAIPLVCKKAVDNPSATGCESLLLTDSDMSPYARKGDPNKLESASELMDSIDGGYNRYTDFGFKRVVVQVYSNSTQEFTIAVFDQTDSANAAACYTGIKSNCTTSETITGYADTDAYMDVNSFLNIYAIKYHVGKYYVEVTNLPYTTEGKQRGKLILDLIKAKAG